MERNEHERRRQCWALMPGLIAEVQAAGDSLGLPFIAAQADLSDPEPMSDIDGTPYAVSTFRWIDPTHEYWRDRKLALQVTILTAARLIAEPFYFANGALHTWRPTGLLDGIDCRSLDENPDLSEAIVTPVHLPRGLVGAIVWCAKEPVGVAEVFAANSERLHLLALKVLATHNEARGRPRSLKVPQNLTRREVQCLRWAAAGKTDREIGMILGLSISTARFHLRNAAVKLGATGRAQSIQLAAGLGYVGV